MKLPAISRGRALAYVALLAVVLVVTGRFVAGAGEAESEARAVHTAAALEHAPSTEAVPAEQLLVVVHVTGAVRRPGLYRLPAGSRVDDAIREAGGAKRRAALELVNLAAPLADGQQVLVPLRGTAGGGAGTPAGEAPVAGPVNLNAATLDDLDALPGIGPVTAQKILDYRERHGPFTSVEELDAIPGIGPARLEQLRELVTV